MKKVLIADDHWVLIDAMEALFRELAPETVLVSASNVEEALGRLIEHPDIDLVLLDYEMPGMEGHRGVQRFKQLYPDLPCAILSGRATPELTQLALTNGADGFIPKTVRGRPLVQIMRLLAAGEKYAPPAMMLAIGAPRAAEEPKIILTPREVQIMELLRGGLSNKMIARQLGVEEGTIKQQLRAIFLKLGVSSRLKALSTYYKYNE